MGQFVWEDSKYSFQFVYHQIRARLLGSSKTDFSQESNYGVLCYETKSILLDILIAMCRLKDPKSPGGFFLEPRLVMAGSVKPVEVEENNNTSRKMIGQMKDKLTKRSKEEPKVEVSGGVVGRRGPSSSREFHTGEEDEVVVVSFLPCFPAFWFF